MTAPRYMVLRKVAVVWVPLTMWNEAQGWDALGRAALFGFSKPQALEVINENRKHLPEGTRYRIQPMEQFLKEELK